MSDKKRVCDRAEKINNDFSDLFAAGGKWLSDPGGELMNRHRGAAFDRFLSLGGIPVKTEAYKYAELLPVFDHDYKVVLRNIKQELDMEEIFTCHVAGLDTYRLLVLNGWPVTTGGPEGLPPGVVVSSLSKAMVDYPELLAAHYNRHAAPGDDDSLVALNTAFSRDGVFVYIPDGVVVDRPIQVVNLLRAHDDLMAFQRNLIVVGKQAQVNLLVCDHTLADQAFLMNNVTEMVLEEGARADYYQVQNQHLGASQINTLFVTQRRDSRFESNIISLYGGFIRNNLFVSLTEEGGAAHLYGMYLSDKNQQVDNFTSIDHQAPRCTSYEHFKGVLDDTALANFAGRITVRPHAQQTEAYQTNNNLLLTDTARINTKPQLVIDADDVKCTHGATVGQMDEDALFYLRSRGIGADEARLMLMFGFSHEIVGRIKLEQLRHQIDDLVEKRLRGELSKCHHCVIQCNR